MRYIGCLLIALAGAGMGMYGSHLLHRRAAYLRRTAGLLRAVECQLPYTAQPMAVLWRRLAAQGVYENCRLLRDTVAALGEDTPFPTAFSAAVETARAAGLLTTAGHSLLSECGAGLGRYDLTRQAAHLCHYRQQTEELAAALEREAAERGRLYRVVGLAGGAALALLLL